MDTDKILSALSYFSIFFAGFIFPLVLFFATSSESVKEHAKKAFISHIIPLLSVPLLLFAVFMEPTFTAGANEIPFFFLGSLLVSLLLSFIVVIWNIIKGIKVFTV
ncbi:DUF4870 domain-containing protein [Cytobacillus gottheilii]|uniref:DUF4870 domain-containing protein n=1 Tax=Cytobacillus gottheilii TaxID=859144 RepID=UPI0009B9BDD5|nr:DUF4870 domain-containing protein [Cytobacillus gottheilii]